MLNSYYANTDNYINYFYHKSKESQDMVFHFQDKIEIYFFISGSVTYFIEKNGYQLRNGDLLVINSNEIHKATFRSEDTYERIVILFKPEIASLFSSNTYNLLNCFINRPKGEQNKIGLNNLQIAEIMGIFSKFNAIYKDDNDTTALLKLTYFIELLVFINRVFSHAKSNESRQILSKKLVPILDFIDNNISSDLSLQSLEEKFYINRYYLSSLFKKSTGINIHNYIVQKRIYRAKTLLSENFSISEVCSMSGFCDYSHFIRAFKMHVGTSPGQYKKQHAFVEKKNFRSFWLPQETWILMPRCFPL